MAVRIASNVSSLTSQRRLGEATRELSAVSERLSSGLRINRASDDAAGLQIAEGLRSDSKVFGQAIRNVNDGLSLLNIAQGATEQLSSIVTRQAELAEQAINGTYSYNQRLALHAEAAALTEEYNRIIQTASFNGIDTLTGITNALRVQLGYGTNGGIEIGVGNKIGFAAGSGEVGLSGGFNDFYALGGAAFVTDVSIADLNGDGIPDLVASESSTSTLMVLLGNGDGTFLAGTSFQAGSGALSVSIADFNGDGIADLVSADNGANTLSVMLGNGDGTFSARRSFQSGTDTYAASVADFNNDGIMDLVSADAGSNTLSVLLGNGDGTFLLRRSFQSGSAPNSVSVADFNGDGIMDLVSADTGNTTLSVLLGNGDGTFLARRSFQTGNSPTAVSIGDFNGDGIVDLVSTDSILGKVDVLLGNGDGTFRARNSFQAGGVPTALTVADMNGDGVEDLISSNYDGGSISVLLGNGNGTFLAQEVFGTGDGPRATSVADFNGDGIPDIVSADETSFALSVFLGVADSSGRRNNRLEEQDLTTRYGAKQALEYSRAALTRITAELGNLGAYQSRLSVANQTLLTSRENFDSARSQLVDADIAKESATLVSTRIRQQSATAVLAQANQQPELALKLLAQSSAKTP